MTSVPAEEVLPSVLEFCDHVFAQTQYEDKADAATFWDKMRADIPGQAQMRVGLTFLQEDTIALGTRACWP